MAGEGGEQVAGLTADYYKPGHYYYNHVGEPIDLIEWAQLTAGDRKILRQDSISTPTVEAAILRTVYLGFVDPSINEARLFGTALLLQGVAVHQLSVYDTEQQAIVGHMEHWEAILLGFHCNRCRLGLDHQD